MTVPSHRRIDAPKLIDSVLGDDDYEKNKRVGNLCHAFTTTALTLIEMGTDKDGKRPRLADQLDVSTKIPSFITSVTALDKAKSGNYTLPSDVRKKYVVGIVVFNHALEAMIKADPEATPDEVIAFLVGIYTHQYKNSTEKQKTAAKEHFERRLVGMVSEIVFDQLAEYSDYEVRGVSVEDDKDGIDRFIKIGNDWIGADAKTSDAAAKEARIDHPKNFIVSTGIPKDVMKGKLCLSPNNVVRYAPAFKEEIERELERHASVV